MKSVVNMMELGSLHLENKIVKMKFFNNCTRGRIRGKWKFSQ